MPPCGGILCASKLLAFLALLGALALLVRDTAAGLASGLAGSLALAAATVLGAVAQVLGLQSLNALHKESPSYLLNFSYCSILFFTSQSTFALPLAQNTKKCYDSGVKGEDWYAEHHALLYSKQ